MNVKIQSVKFDADKRLVDFIQAKMDKMDRFVERAIGAQVTLRIDKDDEQGGIWCPDNKNNVMFNLFGVLPFKQLQIRIFTKVAPQEFGINRVELKRVKFKTKTIG